jgi:hypothetical protein
MDTTMKMKFILVFSVVFIQCCQSQNQNLNTIQTTDSIVVKNRNLLKDYFLCSCIDKGFKNDSLQKKESSISIIVEMSDYFPSAFQKIDSVADSLIRSIPTKNTNEEAPGPAIMLNCITYYKSKELNRLVESLDSEIDNRKLNE